MLDQWTRTSDGHDLDWARVHILFSEFLLKHKTEDRQEFTEKQIPYARIYVLAVITMTFASLLYVCEPRTRLWFTQRELGVLEYVSRFPLG